LNIDCVELVTAILVERWEEGDTDMSKWWRLCEFFDPKRGDPLPPPFSTFIAI
jgi:hypothetical protein